MHNYSESESVCCSSDFCSNGRSKLLEAIQQPEHQCADDDQSVKQTRCHEHYWIIFGLDKPRISRLSLEQCDSRLFRAIFSLIIRCYELPYEQHNDHNAEENHADDPKLPNIVQHFDGCIAERQAIVVWKGHCHRY